MTFENRSGKQIASIEIEAATVKQIVKPVNGEFERIRIYPKFEENYEFQALVKFEDGSTLQFAQSMNGSKVTLVIFPDIIALVVKKGWQW